VLYYSRTLLFKTKCTLPIFSMLGYAKVKQAAQSADKKKKAEPGQKKKKQLPTMTAPRKEKTKVKIILTDDVAGLGYKGEHLAVAKGYGRNFLFPQGLAVHNTPDNAIQYEEFTKVLFVIHTTSNEMQIRSANPYSASFFLNARINIVLFNRKLILMPRRRLNNYKKQRRSWPRSLLMYDTMLI